MRAFVSVASFAARRYCAVVSPLDAVWHWPSKPRYCTPLHPVKSPVTSATAAIEGTPVPVVFFTIPVAKPARLVLLSLLVVVAHDPALDVVSPVSAGWR